jgi:hypothetical protein
MQQQAREHGREGAEGVGEAMAVLLGNVFLLRDALQPGGGTPSPVVRRKKRR